ncbi:hypothetical protein PTKU64_89900 [Paraburkholderia terrae]|uniref:Uncharacterized protein n=1 Tax=Paraburkholderia terrae TaxID=311230 RepID=A0ABM7U290_9BURK|nr:hypothetical protein PTKU64_89900 [Paraburkholderia terrae]BDC45618.1 hypothetical protein PTKU15_89150 [Paraburkholderia terrae]
MGVGSEASACASGLSVTMVDDVGDPAGLVAIVLPDVAAAPDVSELPDGPRPAYWYVCAIAELVDETDMLAPV